MNRVPEAAVVGRVGGLVGVGVHHELARASVLRIVGGAKVVADLVGEGQVGGMLRGVSLFYHKAAIVAPPLAVYCDMREKDEIVQRTCTGLGKRVVPRLREFAPHSQRESGGGIHATYGPLFCPALYNQSIGNSAYRA